MQLEGARGVNVYKGSNRVQGVLSGVEVVVGGKGSNQVQME